MKIFLSWSGHKSKMVARALKSGLEKLSNKCAPWLSDDLTPGTQWAKELSRHIKQADVAVICLTRRNVSAPWISFEAGVCHSSPIEDHLVVPYLLDLDAESLQFPIGLFQAVAADYRGTKALFWSISKKMDIQQKAFETRFEEELWPELESRLRTIQNIGKEGERVEEEGNWLNIANAFFLGHDLRWTMAAIKAREPLDQIQHGLRQILHQADELGLSQHEDFKILTIQCDEVLKSNDASWGDDHREKLVQELHDAFQAFGRLMKQRQPGYTSYPPDNHESWLRLKSMRRC
jgi:hypothetical protein